MKSSFFLPLLVLSAWPCFASSLTITTTALPTGTLASPYSAVINASGGCTPYQWAITSGKLPTGVLADVSAGTTSLDLTGTPTIASTYSFTVSVTGCGGEAATGSFKLVVDGPGVTITTASLPNATVGSTYSAAIDGSNGCTPYKWAITSGKLPAGIADKASSNTEALDLSGIPTTAATYSFTATVTGCGGHTDSASYKVVVQSSAKNVVDLSWIASISSDIAGYNIYRSPNGSIWSKLNATLIASTLYSDSTVAADTTYYYAATSVDTAGRESAKTAPVKAVIP